MSAPFDVNSTHPVAAGTYGLHNTDLGNAERFISRYGQRLRFVHERAKWAHWDGRHWQLDQTGVVVKYAYETVRRMYNEAAEIEDPKLRQQAGHFAIRSESERSINAMVSLAKNLEGVTVSLNDFDPDPWLLNCGNGTIDLRTGNLLPHDPARMQMKLVPFYYLPEAESPLWLSFLERVLPDVAVRDYIQRAVGYAMTGDVSEQILFLLHGGGNNGKSTFLETIRELTTDYGHQSAPELLVAKREGQIPNDVAALEGVRFVSTIEVEDGRRLAEALVKQLTGGDRISARFMRQDYFEFSPTFKIFFAVNHKPVIRGNDNAIWRRIKMIPFEVTIPKNERDKDLPTKLKDEMPGILAWAVEGCLKWQKNGLQEPEVVRDAVSEYRTEMDVIGRFIADCCVVGSNKEILATPLYKTYENWCEQTGELAKSQTAFGRDLTKRGLRADTRSGVGWRIGIGLAAAAHPDPLGGTGHSEEPFSPDRSRPLGQSGELGGLGGFSESNESYRSHEASNWTNPLNSPNGLTPGADMADEGPLQVDREAISDEEQRRGGLRMSLAKLLILLRAGRFHLSVDSRGLVVKPASALTDELRSAIRLHRDALGSLPHPFLNDRGDLVIPLDAPPQYHWQPLRRTLCELGADDDTLLRYTGHGPASGGKTDDR